MSTREERLAKIREVEHDPARDRHATGVALKIRARADVQAHKTIAAQAARASSPKSKVFLLRQLADSVVKAAAPVVACTRGCSHCCHMPVMIGASEAIQIAKETGAQMVAPDLYKFPPKGNMDFDGVACTFLVDGACSIYSSRPFACRVHMVGEPDETLCEIFPGESITVRHVNVDPYHQAYANTYGPLEFRQMADVREFFPHGLRRKGPR